MPSVRPVKPDAHVVQFVPPAARARQAVLVEHAQAERQHVGQHAGRHGSAHAIGGDRQQHARPGAGGDVHVVVADAEAGHEHQPVSALPGSRRSRWTPAPAARRSRGPVRLATRRRRGCGQKLPADAGRGSSRSRPMSLKASEPSAFGEIARHADAEAVTHAHLTPVVCPPHGNPPAHGPVEGHARMAASHSPRWHAKATRRCAAAIASPTHGQEPSLVAAQRRMAVPGSGRR